MLEDGDAPRNYAMFGADFSTLHKSCAAPILVSDDLTTADTYDNQEWVESVYRVGSVIHGLIHNEFHDPIAPDCKVGDSTPGNPCWYNSITYGVSSDGGHTFTHAAPPAHLLAPPPEQWNPQGPPPPYGYFEPSNVVLAQDNFYYAVFRGNNRNAPLHICLMRTQMIGDPTSWRAWDGSDFNLRMTDPYTGPSPSLCAGVAPDLGEPTLTYNTYLGKYMMEGNGGFVRGTKRRQSPHAPLVSVEPATLIIHLDSLQLGNHFRPQDVLISSRVSCVYGYSRNKFHERIQHWNRNGHNDRVD